MEYGSNFFLQEIGKGKKKLIWFDIRRMKSLLYDSAPECQKTTIVSA